MKHTPIIILFIFFSCRENNVPEASTETNQISDVDSWKEKFYLRNTSNAIDAQTGLPIQRKNIDGAEFSFVQNDSGKLVKEWTHDPNFITEEGYSVGTEWSKISDSLKQKHYILPGWGIYIDLTMGWRLCFCVGNSCTDSLPSETEPVKWIERRI